VDNYSFYDINHGKIKLLNNNLSIALNSSVISAFVPGGNFTRSLLDGIQEPFNISMLTHLASIVEPLIAAALAAQAVPATSAPVAAWAAVKAPTLVAPPPPGF